MDSDDPQEEYRLPFDADEEAALGDIDTGIRPSPYKPVEIFNSIAELSSPFRNTNKGKQKQVVIELDDDDQDIEELAFGSEHDSNDALDDGELNIVLKEVSEVEKQINELQNLRAELLKKVRAIKEKKKKASIQKTNPKPAFISAENINYHTSDFKWSVALQAKIYAVWKIKKFRAVQEGVCNAVMANRDVVIIMPTGAGKSLTYQAPALMTKGTSIVVSPLLALSSDQVFHLSEVGVEAMMLSSANSKSESNEILKRLSNGPQDGEKEIKLLYLTPEKIAKSKTLVNALQRCYDDRRLARIVIDEAHCASALGHDFRPDYRKLNVFKTLFPKTPIIALTATCPLVVLDDILKILQLGKTTPGSSADPRKGTVLFTAPLYRPNLHYCVMPRASNAKEALEEMATWIKEKHEGDLGIVYCLSQKDTQTLAEGLRTHSVKTAIYNASLDDAEKERVHSKWRAGKVQVICATIAFGLGIDQPNVRFVIHQMPSKSIDALYQESGRGGRDGNQADCLVYFRAGQDVSRLSSLVCREVSGSEKLVNMLAYATDLRTCRKQLFGTYFDSERFSPVDGDGKCGHCDNCMREPETIEIKNVSLEAWSILTCLDKALAAGGRLTLPALADLARGLGKGEINVAVGEGKHKVQSKAKIEVQDKIKLNKEEAEFLIANMLGKGYLGFFFHATAYTDISYMAKGRLASRLLRLDRAAVADFAYDLAFYARKKRKSAKRKVQGDDEDEEESSGEEQASPPKKACRKTTTKKKEPEVERSIMEISDD